MKVYVIKDKKGKYLCEDCDQCSYWNDNFAEAIIIEEKSKCLYRLREDEYWQEVTLAEGDLEKELEVYKKAILELYFNTGVISEILVSQSKKELTNTQTRNEIIKYMYKIDLVFDEVKDKLGVDIFIKLRKEEEN